ncbi:MAG: hypothetical protein ABI353_08010 [Isosphaeraceae bacterium]
MSSVRRSQRASRTGWAWFLVLAVSWSVLPVTNAADPPRRRAADPRDGWYDIRDYGAQPGHSPEQAARTHRVLQGLVDLLARPGHKYSRTIYIPGADEPWTIDRPVFLDQSQITIQGDGPSSIVQMAPDRDDSCFFVGISRTPRDKVFTPDHWIDLFGKLDASAAPRPGVRWGLRTRGDSHIAQGAGPFCYGTGDYWAETRQLTVEFALDFSVTPYHDFAFFGVSGRGQPQPWMLFGAAGEFVVAYRTRDGSITGGTVRMFRFKPPAGRGVHRIAFQIDLTTARVSAFVDAVEVATTGDNGGTDFQAASNLKFSANQNMPFKINAAGTGANSFSSDYFEYDHKFARDLWLYGLRVSKTIRYATAGVGRRWRRRDGTPIDDAHTFFEADAETVALLPLQDPPKSGAASRLVSVKAGPAGGGRNSSALFLSPEHGTPYSAQGPHHFRDVTVKATPGFYGDAVTLGFALDFSAERSQFHGGAHGIGSWNWGANYVTRLRDCQFTATDASIYNHYGQMELTACRFHSHGRATIWADLGIIRAHNLWCAYGGKPEFIVKLTNGGAFLANHFEVDIEGGDYPSIAGFYAESSNQGGSVEGGRLDLKDIAFGTIGPKSPLVLLHQTNPFDPPSAFRLEGLILVGGSYPALVQTDGRVWNGEIQTEVQPTYPPVLHTNSEAGGIVSRHRRFIGPPRETTWTRGAHRLDVTMPADAQFTLWRCVATGSYGTAKPPRWQGFDPVDAGENGLAAYLTGHSYWSAGVRTHHGAFTNQAHAAVLNQLFVGTEAPAPKGLYIGLSTVPAQRDGGVIEPQGQGYARAAIPREAWSASKDGTSANIQAVTFPKAEADWADVHAVFLADAAKGGRVVAAIDVAPLTVKAGVAVSFTPGQLAVAQASGPRGISLDLADAFNGFWLHGQALKPLTVHIALSTGPANLSSGPKEPASAGYARLAVPSTSWSKALDYGRISDLGIVTNSQALRFTRPTGPWGTVRSVYLMDLPQGGRVLAAAALTIPRSPLPDDPAPEFAPGALWISTD